MTAEDLRARSDANVLCMGTNGVSDQRVESTQEYTYKFTRQH